MHSQLYHEYDTTAEPLCHSFMNSGVDSQQVWRPKCATDRNRNGGRYDNDSRLTNMLSAFKLNAGNSASTSNKKHFQIADNPPATVNQVGTRSTQPNSSPNRLSYDRGPHLPPPQSNFTTSTPASNILPPPLPSPELSALYLDPTPELQVANAPVQQNIENNLSTCFQSTAQIGMVPLQYQYSSMQPELHVGQPLINSATSSSSSSGNSLDPDAQQYEILPMSKPLLVDPSVARQQKDGANYRHPTVDSHNITSQVIMRMYTSDIFCSQCGTRVVYGNET